METLKSYEELPDEIQELSIKLEEANDTIEAFRTGLVDAIVVNGPKGHKLYALKTADHTYRVFIEKMSEGAVTFDQGGYILYCNSSFANLVQAQPEKVIGMPFENFIAEESKKTYNKIAKKVWKKDIKEELSIRDGN